MQVTQVLFYPLLKIGSYGNGSATINGQNGDGLFAYNTAGFFIHDLNFTGSGTTTNNGSGINFYTDLPGNTKLPGITIQNVNAHHFGKQGILIGSWNQQTGYADVNIASSTLYKNGLDGLNTYSELPLAHLRVSIDHEIGRAHV